MTTMMTMLVTPRTALLSGAAEEPVWSWAGALLGGVVALGAVLVVAGVPWRRGPDLEARLAPYVSDAPRPSRLLFGAEHGSGTLTRRALHAGAVRLGHLLERVLGGSASVRRRLERAAAPLDVEGFRAEQAVWGALSGVLGVLLASALWVRTSASLPVMVVVVVGAVALGVVARDQALSRSVTRREHRINSEFPAIAELLALSVTAGEGAGPALERVARLSSGELSSELERCLADARAGASLPVALQGLADRAGLPSLRRFVDGIVVAVERGTPLAEVLRAQAQDAREAGRQSIIEEGGKKEILMMVPVVFLVLPVTVLFAVYPGFSMLRLAL